MSLMTTDEPMGLMVDRALAQTAEAGLRYAVIPEPWMQEWFLYLGRLPIGTRGKFNWFHYCGDHNSWDCDKFPKNDGDVYVCLIPLECEPDKDWRISHEGPCGYARLLEPNSRRVQPIAEGFEHIPTLGAPPPR